MGGLWRLALCFLASSALLAAAEEEENPFVELAKTFLKEQMQGQGGSSGAAGALGAVGAMLQSFMQGGGGRQLGELLKDSDFLSTMGSVVAGAMGKDPNNPNSPGIDPQMISNLVDAFAPSHSDENNNDVKQGREKPQQDQEQGQIDWASMMNLALSLAGSQQDKKEGGEGNPLQGLLGLLPTLMQLASNVGGETARAQDNNSLGEARPSLFAPMLSALRDYWEHFMSSELGQMLWKTSGLEDTFKLFTDKDGNLDTERIYRSLENASFRKRWVRSLATYVAEWIAHVSDPVTQKRYLTTAQFMGNGFLKAQGYPKSVMFDPARPSESLTRIVNAVFKRQFGLKIDSATYIKPAVAYLQEVFKLGQAKGLSLSHLSPKEIEDKLTDTISGHVIEPTMRVWRAYWYATRHPQCEQYVICTVNQRDTATEEGLKPGVTKLSSMVAIWFLSSNNGSSFWKLYSAAVEGHDCAVQYPANCTTFHEEDIKATTEYIHSEL